MTTSNTQITATPAAVATPADLAALTAEQKQERLGALYDALDAVDAQDAEISDLIPFLAALGISAKVEDDGEGRLPGTMRLVLGVGWLEGTNADFEATAYLWIDTDGDLCGQEHNPGNSPAAVYADDVMVLLEDTVLEWAAMHPARCEDLDELWVALERFGSDMEAAGVDLTSLPTFGGEEPSDTQGVYSWDEGRLLIDDGDGGYEIVER